MEEEKDVKLNEDTAAFTDLMSRSERREWERARQEEINKQLDDEKESIVEVIKDVSEDKKESKKDKKRRQKEENKNKNSNESENKIVDEIIKDEEPIKLIDEIDDDSELEAKTNELNVGELSKTQSIPIITDEMKESLFYDMDNLKENNKSFNPIPLLGIGLIVSFIYFIYLVFVSDCNINSFLIINGSILLLTILIFCITTLVNKKAMKVFTIINLILIICFIGFNILSIFNWHWFDNTDKEKIVDNSNNNKDNNPIDNAVETSYLCSNKENSIEVNIKEKNGYITHLKRIEVYENKSIAEEMKSYFEDTLGFSATLSEETLLTEYNFDALDINQYKIMIKTFNDAFTIETDFSYITNDKIGYVKYKEVELAEFTCIKKEAN